MTTIAHHRLSGSGAGSLGLASTEIRPVRVLVVEHDEEQGKAVHHALEDEGYVVELAADLLDGLRSFTDDPADVVVLDVRLPSVASAEVCRRMHVVAPVPVVMSGVAADGLDRAGALELGAADFLDKPYSVAELVASIEGARGRVDPSWSAPSGPSSAIAVRRDGMTVGALYVDFAAREVKRHGRPVHLPRREFDLLGMLLSPPGQLRTRAELVERLWSGTCVPGSRTLDTHIRRLRLKLEDDPARPRHLVTIRGVGFRFDAGAGRPASERVDMPDASG